MSKVMTKTTKFDNMLQAFECDFDLALQGEKTLSELQANIANGDERILQDIELLKELAYLIRSGRAEIRVSAQRLWYIRYTDARNGSICVLDTIHNNEVKVVVFQNDIEAHIALGNLQKNNSNFTNAEVKSFEVEEKGKFINGTDYLLMNYKNGNFVGE